jgi:hypothetical protein
MAKYDPVKCSTPDCVVCGNPEGEVMSPKEKAAAQEILKNPPPPIPWVEPQKVAEILANPSVLVNLGSVTPSSEALLATQKKLKEIAWEGLMKGSMVIPEGAEVKFFQDGVIPPAPLPKVSDGWTKLSVTWNPSSPPQPEEKSLQERVKAAVAKKVPPLSPVEQKEHEELAVLIQDISKEHGVRGMTGFASLAVAKALLDEMKKQQLSKLASSITLAAKSLKASQIVAATTAAEQFNDALASFVPPPKPQYAFKGMTLVLEEDAYTPVDFSIHDGAAVEVKAHVPKWMLGKAPAAELEKYALQKLQKQAAANGFALITPPHIVGKNHLDGLNVSGWAISLAHEVAMSPATEAFTVKSDWGLYAGSEPNAETPHEVYEVGDPFPK